MWQWLQNLVTAWLESYQQVIIIMNFIVYSLTTKNTILVPDINHDSLNIKKCANGLEIIKHTNGDMKVNEELNQTIGSAVLRVFQYL